MIKLPFNQLFGSKFEAGFKIVTTKLIKSCLDCIEKVDIYWNRLVLYQSCLKMIKKVKINQLFYINWHFRSLNKIISIFKLTFSIFLLIFIDLLIKKRLKRIYFNWKYIKSISKLRSSIPYCSWNRNRIVIDNIILKSWNLNCRQFNW